MKLQPPRTIWQVLGFVWEMGFIIAIPIVLLGTLGKYLDQRWGTKPWLTLLGIILAMISSGLWLYRYLRSLMEFKTQPPKLEKPTQDSELQ